MANIKSQIKRNRQNVTRRQRNRARRSALRTKVKDFITAAEAGDETAAQKLGVVNKALDQAADAGVIHKNTAANKKSRLTKKLTP